MKRVIVMVLLGLGAALGVMVPSLAQSVGDESSPVGEQSPPGPDFTDAVVTVTPSTDLVDRQVVTVSGEFFDPPNSGAGVLQCLDFEANTGSVESCDLSTLVFASTDADGKVQAELTVRREISIGGETIDCAEPDACTVAVGTIGSDGLSANEGATAKVSFDPDVDPLPPLTAEVSITEVNPLGVTGTVTCSAEAEVYIDANLSQSTGGNNTNLYFSVSEQFCGPTPTEWTVLHQYRNGRLVPGEALMSLYLYAYDNFETTSTQTSQTVNVTALADESVVISLPGDFITVEVAGVRGVGQNSQILLDVTCTVPAEYVSLSFSLTQYLGRETVNVNGNSTLAECGPTERVAVRFRNGSGRVGPGTARVTANASGSIDSPPDDFTYDFAQASAPVRLVARVPASAGTPPIVSGAYLEITRFNPRRIVGVVTCDVPATVDVDLAIVQERANRTINTRSFASVDCDGRTRFSIRVPALVRSGPAVAYLYSYAHREISVDDLPYTITEYLWEDFVGRPWRARR
jgi:hypothetical protein